MPVLTFSVFVLGPPLPPPALLLHGCEMIRLSSGSTNSTNSTSASLRSRPVDTVLQLQDVHEYIRELLHVEYLQVVTSLIADPKGKHALFARSVWTCVEWCQWLT